MRAALTSRVSLRVRLILLAAVVSAVVFTSGALFLYVGLSNSLDDAVTAELRVRSDDMLAEMARSGGAVPALLGEGPPTQILSGEGEVLEPAGEQPLLVGADVDQAGQHEVVVDQAVDQVGTNARILATPAETPDGTEVIVVVAGSTGPVVAARERLAVVLGVAGPIMVLLAVVASWVFIGAALRPVRRMTRRADTISLEDPQARLPEPPGADEIAELGHTLNRMLDRIAATIEHERAFIDDASHELRTPLAVLRGEIELALLDLRESNGPEEVQKALASAIDETDRLAELANHLLMLARADAGDLASYDEPVALLDLVQRVVERADEGSSTIEVIGDDVVVAGDPTALEQVVTNLVTNAVRWSRSRVIATVRAKDKSALLEISDDGPGFSPDIVDRATDRFVRAGAARTRDSGGSGLGLAIVAAVVGAHGGKVVVGNGKKLGGAWVRVRLPLLLPTP